ncbi:MAG TPA: HlyD family secretion protein [Polyangia bacterium]|nr:HlyD family secretion protein [Polyangia bacterium]
MGAVVIVACIVIGIVVYYLYRRRFESTDDAQVDANISNIGPRVAGTISAVFIVENQRVQAGDRLAEIDPTDLEVAQTRAQAAVAQAAAQLAVEDPSVLITQTTNAAALTNATAGIESAQAALAGSRAETDQATARLAEAKANANNAALDLERGRQLFARGALARSDLDRRESAAAATAAAAEAAQQSVETARARVAQQRASIAGVQSHLSEVRRNAPRQLTTSKAAVQARQADLARAQAEARQAALNLAYAQMRTPVAGIVARKAVNVGDSVQPGQVIAAIAQTDEPWVTANFEETQLRRMQPGQHASIHVDALDRDFTGSVQSLGGATGSRMSLLPPENASGNYVKVVQRIPVRIRFDPDQPGLGELRPGMSVEPKVRVAP